MSNAVMTVAWVVELIEESTQSIPGTIVETTDLEAMDEWDSLSMVMFISLVDEEVGVELDADDIQAGGTPLKLLAAIADRVRR